MSDNWDINDLAARISDPDDPTRLLVVFAFVHEMSPDRAAAHVYVLGARGVQPIHHPVTSNRSGSLVVEGENMEDTMDRLISTVADAIGVSEDDVITVGSPPPLD